jgi:hypothetical protein
MWATSGRRTEGLWIAVGGRVDGESVGREERDVGSEEEDCL